MDFTSFNADGLFTTLTFTDEEIRRATSEALNPYHGDVCGE
jgi:hypothetical protein